MSSYNIPNYIIQDLLCRFIINVPECERQLQRIAFKLQDAFWHYIDFYAQKKEILQINNNRILTHDDFDEFIDIIKVATPFLRNLPDTGREIKKEFYEYKKKIPRYGCIIINQDRTKLLLIKNAFSKKYSFPKGQINFNETPLDCAIRETVEEIGFNVAKYIIPDVCLLHEQRQNTHCYYIADKVNEKEIFKAIARNEIEDIKWVEVSAIRSKKNNKEYSNIVELIDSIQLVINRKEDDELKKQQKKNQIDFEQKLKQISNQFIEFCQDEYMMLTEEHIFQNVSNSSDSNPFLNFKFDESKFTHNQ
ncbi:hypothetical protein ABPG74_000343 [Tetrahymena malaccensis]